MVEKSVERLLGELTASVQGLARDVSELKENDKEDAGKRKALYTSIDAVRSDLGHVKTDITLIKQEWREAKPDLARCRMFRHWGIVSASFIALGASTVAFWDHLRKLFHAGVWLIPPLLVLGALPGEAKAHDWLTRHPHGNECCNDKDCRPAKEGEVTNVNGVWYVHGKLVTKVYTNTAETLPAAGQIWVCLPAYAEPCLFLPGVF